MLGSKNAKMNYFSAGPQPHPLLKLYLEGTYSKILGSKMLGSKTTFQKGSRALRRQHWEAKYLESTLSWEAELLFG